MTLGMINTFSHCSTLGQPLWFWVVVGTNRSSNGGYKRRWIWWTLNPKTIPPSMPLGSPAMNIKIYALVYNFAIFTPH